MYKIRLIFMYIKYVVHILFSFNKYNSSDNIKIAISLRLNCNI
jgi:hypothetical protein